MSRPIRFIPIMILLALVSAFAMRLIRPEDPAILSQLKSLLETGKLLGIPRAALNKGFDAK